MSLDLILAMLYCLCKWF